MTDQRKQFYFGFSHLTSLKEGAVCMNRTTTATTSSSEGVLRYRIPSEYYFQFNIRKGASVMCGHSHQCTTPQPDLGYTGDPTTIAMGRTSIPSPSVPENVTKMAEVRVLLTQAHQAFSRQVEEQIDALVWQWERYQTKAIPEEHFGQGKPLPKSPDDARLIIEEWVRTIVSGPPST